MTTIPENEQRKLNEELWLACLTGDMPKIKKAVEAGADVNCRDGILDGSDEDFTPDTKPLWILGQGGYTEASVYLIEHGADVDFVDTDGTTALIQATQQKYAKTAEALYSAGANPRFHTKGNKSAIDIAKSNHNYALVKFFETPRERLKALSSDIVLKPVLSPKQQRKLDAALWMAVKRGNITKVAELIEDGANANCDGKSTSFVGSGKYMRAATALLVAIDQGYEDIARLLVQHGADPRRAFDGYLPYKHARTKGLDVLARFLENKAEELNAAASQPLLLPAAKVEKNIALQTNDNEDEIILTRKLGGVILTEVFNFKARERITWVSAANDAVPTALTRQNFIDIDDQDALHAAFEKYKNAGGKIAEHDAFPSVFVRKM